MFETREELSPCVIILQHLDSDIFLTFVELLSRERDWLESYSDMILALFPN